MQSKEIHVTSHEIDDLNQANSYYRLFRTNPSARRKSRVQLFTFEFTSDDESTSKELDNKIEEMIQSTDTILYEKIRSIVSNNTMFIDSLISKRTLSPSTSISQTAISIANLHRLNADTLEQIICAEKKTLETAIKNYPASDLEHTDIQERIKELKRLSKQYSKRKLDDEDKHSGKKKQKSGPNLSLEFYPVENTRLNKSACLQIIEKIHLLLKEVGANQNKKDLFLIHFLINNARKNLTRIKIKMDWIESLEGKINGLLPKFINENTDFLQICEIQLNDFQTEEITAEVSGLCSRLGYAVDYAVSLVNHQEISSKDFDQKLSATQLPFITTLGAKDNNNSQKLQNGLNVENQQTIVRR